MLMFVAAAITEPDSLLERNGRAEQVQSFLKLKLMRT